MSSTQRVVAAIARTAASSWPASAGGERLGAVAAGACPGRAAEPGATGREWPIRTNCASRAVAAALADLVGGLAYPRSHDGAPRHPADAAACAVPANAGERERPRSAAAPGAVAVPRRGFQAVPAALPVPCHRPAARRSTRAQVRGTLVHAVLERLYDLPAERVPAAARALLAPAWEGLCTASPRAGGGPVHRPGRPRARRVAGVGRRRCWTRTSGWRIRAGWSPRRGSCWWRRSSPRGCCCAATSTGSTSRHRAEAADGGLQDGRGAPSGRRSAGAVPDEVLRARAAAPARHGARPAAAALPRRRRVAHVRARRGAAAPVRRTLEAIWAAILAAGPTAISAPTRPAVRWCSHKALCPRGTALPPGLSGMARATRPRRRRPTAQVDPARTAGRRRA